MGEYLRGLTLEMSVVDSRGEYSGEKKDPGWKYNHGKMSQGEISDGKYKGKCMWGHLRGIFEGKVSDGVKS